ncbi:MAG TPA: rRNA adenine N-6-methyltransferase family protein [Pseudolabrys sp.]|jgi:phosphatidylethanolamine/phosphatidyl-N-methylethanolamine N-methyltransferase|uniref:class I SAM-dependent methyltransferase n=1 Tax=Pseudolabrys sp. TaxID=1960880 RepID=UPI002DDCA1B2|nr:rRNA adenine N-6-methyltransferase family protein [Pseudolabrys sp.]HEV2628023.1 rRNA adenine N-6-methyltransferase family protein [Pseudolabrys sp.]
MPSPSIARVAKKPLRLDDELQFIRSWIDKPLRTGAVMPSSKALARAMARAVDPQAPGPVIELGPGTGPVTAALVERGIDPSRLVLVEFNPDFCRLLRTRYPTATVIQGDAYRLRRLLETTLKEPAAAIVSGLPLLTKPLRTRLRLLADAVAVMKPGAPLVQFTYGVVPPIPKTLAGVSAEPSSLVWLNIPPARIWVYRRR